MRYKKSTPRLTVNFVNGDTEEIIFQVKDRTWMNVGDLLTDNAIDNIMKNEWKGKKLPENLMVLVVADFKLIE